MSDVALVNAEKYRAAIEEQISKKEIELEVLRADLALVCSFISAWHSFHRDSVPAIGEHSELFNLGTTMSGRRPRNPPKERIGDIATQIVEARGQPVSRDAIFAALENEGIRLEGTDPKLILSTMLWRLRPRFVRLKGFGYWLADRDFAPAGYRALEIPRE